MKKVFSWAIGEKEIEIVKIATSSWRAMIFFIIIALIGVYGYTRGSGNKKADCTAEKNLAVVWENLYKEKDKNYQELVIAFTNMKDMVKPKGSVPTSFIEEYNGGMIFANFVDTTKKPLTKDQKILSYADSVLRVQRIKDSLLKARLPGKQ